VYRKRHLPAVVAAACLLLTAAACNGDPDTQTSPTPTSTLPSTTTPSPTKPTSTPPTIPPAATSGLTVTSAEAFARFYIAALDYAIATGDAGPMRQWAYKTCRTCRDYAKTYEQTYKSGGTVTGQLGTMITRVASVRLIKNDTAAVLLHAREGRTIWHKSAGAKPTTFPGGNIKWDLTLAETSGRWTMFEMELQG
jgi:hypothetical protein